MAELLCKYYKRQRYVSYNDGVTWQPLDEYEKGDLYESHSADCGGGTYQYRWVSVSNAYICDGKDKYTREVYEYSEDGVVWYATFPTQYRKGSLVESNSTYCDNAGEGHYISGDTEPISGETGPCPPNYYWNGYECACKGHIINGKCIGCENVKHEHWDDSQQMCVCDRWYERRNGICVYVDPLKIVKCSEANGVIQKSDVDYYESGWAAMSYKIGDCVTRIGDSAFNGQIFLTSATISNTVTEIGNLAFANCRSLETITFPNDITSFGNNVFLQCSSLKNVTFGGTIPSEVPIASFAQCEKLETATWLQYNNITSIGDKAFYNCYSLNNVTLPDTLQTIDENAFYGNRSMTNITIPASVSYIGDKAFSECPTLTSATINTDKVVLGSNVFDGCTSLLKITFTATVPPQISQTALDNSNECKIFVPCDSEEAYKTAWPQYADRISCNDTGIYYRWIDADGFYCDGTDEYTRQKEQQTTNGITWTDTGEYRQSTFITHYSKNCGYVGDVGLTLTNEDGYTRYYYPCDKDAYKFISHYNNGTIRYVACNSDSNLSQNEVSPSSEITSAEIGDCVQTIGDKAFYGCYYGLTSINIPDSVTTIGARAFHECLSLTSATIGSGVTIIGQSAFKETRLPNITIPDSVTIIGYEAFYNCSYLTSVTIGSGVTRIGEAAFRECISLTSVDIPDSVTTIGNLAFCQCFGLTNVTIGSGVTIIGVDAFSYCSGLTSVTIGSGVTSINDQAFYYCTSLTSLTVEALTPPALGRSRVFDYTPDSLIFYVPPASVNAYKTASRWRSYASRIQPIP